MPNKKRNREERGERREARDAEKETERGRTVKTTSIGHKKSKNLKTRFCRRHLSNYFLLVSSKSKIRIQRRFSFYFFSEIRRKEDEVAFRPFFLGNFQLISYPIVFNYVGCLFRDFR